MCQRQQIIGDLEEEFCETLDINFDAGVDELCDGDNCRHGSECICYENFSAAVREQLQKQSDEYFTTLESMRKLHSAEIHYGLHTPSHLENTDEV